MYGAQGAIKSLFNNEQEIEWRGALGKKALDKAANN
jgi:hypothetical protein